MSLCTIDISPSVKIAWAVERIQHFRDEYEAKPF